MTKKICVNLIAIFWVLFIFGNTNKVYALDGGYEYIDDFVYNVGYDAYVEEKIPLYDTSNNINGWMYVLSPAGFVITDENGHIVEANQSINVNSITSYIYYGGYGEYYCKKNDNNYINIVTGETISEEQLLECIIFYNSIKEELYTKSDIISLSETTTIKRLPYATSTYTSSGTVVDGLGVCGYIASAIFLDYYDRYIYNTLLPEQYSCNGVELINGLYSFGNGGSGMAQDELIGVINRFLNACNRSGYLYMAGTTSELYSKLRYSIDRNRPAIVVIKNHSKYGYHVVVGHGYYFENVNGTLYNCIIVNDGWGNTDVIINEAYMESVTYSAD